MAFASHSNYPPVSSVSSQKIAFYSAINDHPDMHVTQEIDIRLRQIREKLKNLGNGNVSLFIPTNEMSADVRNGTSSKVAVISINNPGARNSLSGKMMCELADAVDELSLWEDGAGVILHGENGFFCAGADLKVASAYMLSGSEGMGEEMSYLMHHTTSRLRSLPLISVAAIEGAAVGGGAELATACDFRVMARDSYIRFVHVILSVVPGWGGGTRLTKMIGRRNALRIMCTGDKVKPDKAMCVGLCDEVAERGESVDLAKIFLDRLTCNNTASIRALKAIVSQADDDLYRPSLNHEHDMFSRMWGNKSSVDQIGKGGAQSRKED
eukprot:CFRG5145T1